MYNALPRLSTERLRTDLLRIFDHTESQNTATHESDKQDSSSSESTNDSGPSPNHNNTLLENNNSSAPPERETLNRKWAGQYFWLQRRKHLNYLYYFRSRALRCINARPGVDYIGKRGNEANCGKWWVDKGTFLRKRHWSQKTALITISENIFNLTSYVKKLSK